MTGAGGMAMIAWAMLAQAAVPATPAPATPPPARAEAAQTEPAQTNPALAPEVADERCFAAFASLLPGADTAQVGRYGTAFFYGRLMGRNPSLDLAAALPGAARAVAARMQPELTRCGHELEAAGRALAAASAAAAASAR